MPLPLPGSRSAHAEFAEILAELIEIRAGMTSGAAEQESRLAAIHPDNRASAGNLLHYLAMRRRDLRPLQRRLATLGLSSLGRAEAHALATVGSVISLLSRLLGRVEPPDTSPPAVDFVRGETLLNDHATGLLGPTPEARSVRIMVTMPGEAADDYTLVYGLLAQGMDCMRINCAHDDATAWLRMIGHLRRAEESLGRKCKVAMDLAGPKFRTGPLEPGPAVVRIRPKRDRYGRVLAPALVWLTSDPARHPPRGEAAACLPVPAAWCERLDVGDRIRLLDARGSRRSFTVVETGLGGCWAGALKTTYVTPGMVLRRHTGKHGRKAATAQVGELPHLENELVLREGDQLIVTRDLQPGRPAAMDGTGTILSPATIGCTLSEVFADVRAGEPIWFDDGRIGGVVERVESGRVLVRIKHARAGGAKLRADKGVNLPQSALQLEAMTAKDMVDLAFVAEHADIVELSFVNTARDVEVLHEQLALQGDRRPAVVLKIETRRAFENLRELLLAVMRAPVCGVMIARGDLAVECGFERLAEVQEEILWVCEAAHVPVIWATQVLESLARDGLPSRAEITDAAMGDRAECVMLNKGPHIVEAVRVLNDVLRRMQGHHTKKRSLLRALRLADPPSGEGSDA